MRGIARDTGRDLAGGPFTTGSPNVFVNGMPAVRLWDKAAPHGKGPHTFPSMMVGSSNVFVNGRPVCRAGDLASCGHPAMNGSTNVFAGG
jgi:uncharacterized Zn-binding protein involved in type VI secretion